MPDKRIGNHQIGDIAPGSRRNNASSDVDGIFQSKLEEIQEMIEVRENRNDNQNKIFNLPDGPLITDYNDKINRILNESSFNPYRTDGFRSYNNSLGN